MLLCEVFNSPYKFRWGKKTSKVAEAYFREATGIEYEVRFWLRTLSDNITPCWEWEFSRMPDSKVKTGVVGKIANMANKLWSQPEHQYHTTNTGDSQNIFSTIINIVKQFNNEYQPTVLSCLVEEPKRYRMYTRLMKIIGPGWKMDQLPKEIIIYRS